MGEWFAQPDQASWWAQTITIAYEQARGLRDRHEKTDGSQIQRGHTTAGPSAPAWKTLKTLEWLPEAKPSYVRSVREDNRLLLRLNWPDGTDVLMSVTATGEGKCSVGVQQSKPPNRESAEEAKRFWAKRLDGLRERLEGD